jgi:serine/threonine protein kinase
MLGEIKIPRYSLIREIGKGGSSVDYLATQDGLDRPVVVRILHRDRSGRGVDLGKLFEQEGRLLAQLEHENIVRIYEIGSTDKVFFRVMEYLEGGTLLDKLGSDDFSRGQVINTCAQLAQALHAAHGINVFHQDLRPSSIMFRGAVTPVLTDLGMVRNFEINLDDTATGVVDRTPRYLSPEQLRGHPNDSRSDVYILGLLFYYMLTGEFPCQGSDPAATDMHRVCELLKPLPEELADLQPVVERMLAGNSEERYQSMLEFHDDLCSISQVDAELTAGSFDVSETPAPARRSVRLPALGSLLVIVAGLYAAYQLMPPTFSEADEKDVEQELQVFEMSISKADEQNVEQELQDFEMSMARMHIYGPPGGNATSSLKKMMAITTEYYKVRDAAHRLAEIYLNDAYDSYVNKNLDDAFQLAYKGLAFAPDHEGLSQLMAEVKKDLEKRERELKIESLVDEGNRALDREELLPPLKNSAYFFFEEIASLDPGNRAAESGLREIQLRLAEQARRSWNNEGLSKAEQQARQGLEFFPDSVLLRDLLADIERTEESEWQQKR